MSYIFIGGSQRSGTSLVNQLLCSDEAANPFLAECSYMRHLIQPYISLRNQAPDEIPYYFENIENFRQFQRKLLLLGGIIPLEKQLQFPLEAVTSLSGLPNGR